MTARASVDVSRPLEGVLYQKRDGIATITLDRPERGNSLAPPMMRIFQALWQDVRDDDSIRVAVITASGERHFCTGMDVAEVEGDDAGEVFRDAPFAESVLWSPHQNHVWKPVLCAVNGLCVGGGLHFVVDSDIVLASRNASFMDTHVNVGMVGAIENIGLARRMPLGAALRMTLLGRHYRMTAERAHQLGLVDELVDHPGALLPAALEMARLLARNSPRAVSLSKQAIWGSLEVGYRDSLEQGWSLLRSHWRHPDFSEGPQAFSEKRDPVWNPDPKARSGEGDS